MIPHPLPSLGNSAALAVILCVGLILVGRALIRLHRGEVVAALPLALGLATSLLFALWAGTLQLSSRLDAAMHHEVVLARQTLMARALEDAIATQLLAGIGAAVLCTGLLIGALALTVPGERPRLALGNTALVLGGAIVVTAAVGVLAMPRAILVGRAGLYALAAFGTASAIVAAHRRGPGVQLGTLAGLAFPLFVAGVDQATLAWFTATEFRAIALAPAAEKAALLEATVAGIELLRGFSAVHLILAASMAILGPSPPGTASGPSPRATWWPWAPGWWWRRGGRVGFVVPGGVRMTDPALEAMADFLGALAHPDRLQLLLAVHRGERDVATLAQAVGLSQPRTSQHLALLRAHRLVVSRRDGRRALYRAADPDLVPWLVRGATFLAEEAQRQADLIEGLERLATEG